ncbi:unnamed protein product [Lathyrus oleraceus]
MERLGMIIDNIPNPCFGIKLSHDSTQLFILSRISVHEFLSGNMYLDNSILQFGPRTSINYILKENFKTSIAS